LLFESVRIGLLHQNHNLVSLKGLSSY